MYNDVLRSQMKASRATTITPITSMMATMVDAPTSKTLT